MINIRQLHVLSKALLWQLCGNNIFDFDAQYAKFGGRFLGLFCYIKSRSNLEKKIFLKSKSHEKNSTRHQVQPILMMEMFFDFTTYLKGDYLPDRENNRNWLNRNERGLKLCKKLRRGRHANGS
ncbi:hypothetical protein [Nostoc sp. UHCC 0870]|uniref:hypothetical protein n=1 Tax=Nostoc sp. UHCC 0870 TaxID=2914041 RepID=UPI001EDDE77E|nr:hypothetical protein [Nostoc sp. UHCC 0870]UKP01494.1 hypothetical protein L6494_30135 [Nostoc sp. UHCC 0870]